MRVLCRVFRSQGEGASTRKLRDQKVEGLACLAPKRLNHGYCILIRLLRKSSLPWQNNLHKIHHIYREIKSEYLNRGEMDLISPMLGQAKARFFNKVCNPRLRIENPRPASAGRGREVKT